MRSGSAGRRGDLTLLFSGAALLAALLAAYHNALRGSFQFDDYNVIVDNAAVHSLSAWWHSMPGIRPLLKLSYAVNWLVSPSPAAFIAFNILCHCLNSLLVLVLCGNLCRKLYRESGAHGAVNAPRATLVALLAALIFALHPAQTEAVTYICGRSVVLMSLFYLASLVAGASESRVPRYFYSPLLFALALLTKETAWTLPLALLLVNYQRGQTWVGAARQLWPHGLVLLGIGGALLGASGYRQMLEHIGSLRSPLTNLGWQVDGIFYLLSQPLLSLHTNIDPDLTSSGPAAPLWWLKLLVLLLALAWGIKARRHLSGFAVLWFALQLLPTNSLWPRNDIANDRQLYLALLGPALLLAHALIGLPQRGTALARIALPATVVLLIGLGWATVLRNSDYRDEIGLWQATARDSPYKARVWNNLGYAYQLAGRPQDARKAYIYAQVLDPNNDRARINNLLLPGTVPEVGAGMAADVIVPVKRGD